MLLVGLYLLTLGYSVYLHILRQDWNGLFMCGVAILSLVCVPLGFKILRFQPIYEIYCIQVVFAYIASVLGSTLGGYSYPFFDKILHFTSGFLMLTVGIMVYFFLRKSNEIPKQDLPLFFVFINSFNVMIAVFWEFFEYSMLVFFNNDCINHYTQGVRDSMNDMLCATLAGFLLSVWIFRHRQNFFINTANTFYEINVKKRT